MDPVSPLDVERHSPRLADLLPSEAPLERVATGFRFTEGPLWNPRTRSILFSDIPSNRICRWSEEGGTEVFREPSGKSNGLTWDLRGRLLACEHLNRQVSLTLEDGRVVPVVRTYQGRLLNSPNDLVVHSGGLLFFSDPPYGIQSDEVGEIREGEQPLNGLYRVGLGDGEAPAEPALVTDDFDRPNGLAFSPDERRLYVADTPRYHIRVFDVGEGGALTGGRVLVELPESAGAGRPDGLKVDRLGNIWTTGPGGLWIVAADGEILGHARFPEKTANCAWGDEDYRSLYVTASTSLYRIRTLTGGLPALRG